MKQKLLGVNIDHVATLRQARVGVLYPSPLQAALLAENAGADGITLHLREDRRHIQDKDIWAIKDAIKTRLNFEMAITEEMLIIAEKLMPAYCCLVPEKRAELTTEGGLNVLANMSQVRTACARLQNKGIEVSIFIDAHKKQIEAAYECGAKIIEIHTGAYADASNEGNSEKAAHHLHLIEEASLFAHNIGFQVNAGHGLHYENVQAIARIPEMCELNIGHALVARAVMVGMYHAVYEMKQLMMAEV